MHSLVTQPARIDRVKPMKKIVITGASGLIGWHAHVRLHAVNCACQFQGKAAKFQIVPLDHAGFQCDEVLLEAVSEADAVLHFAGVNRASDDVIATENPALAERLLNACKQARSNPHIAYANSTHSFADNVYGNSKRNAGEKLLESGYHCSNVIYPHIFGESARPYYNNVTATLIDHILTDTKATVNPEGVVSLLHAGEAAQVAIDCVLNAQTGEVNPESNRMGITELYELLQSMHRSYNSNVIPNVQSSFHLNLFNSYRFASYPGQWPRSLKQNEDDRGVLFEAIKGGGGGQTFMSTTKPGVTRGDHFHLGKVERFLVLSGEAIIRIRRVLDDKVWEFPVSGDNPQAVDMPTLCTHSIENTGSADLLTLFWTHELFDPDAPDTYAEPVLT